MPYSEWKTRCMGSHHSFRHFTVLFDSPIGTACGLDIMNVSAGESASNVTVRTMDCNLGVIEERDVTNIEFERL